MFSKVALSPKVDEVRIRCIAMLTLKSQRAVKSPSSTIYAVEGTKGNDGALNALLETMDANGLKFYKTNTKGLLQGPDGLIGPSDVVIVKVNSQWDERGGTNSDLVKTIVAALLAHPDDFKGEVVVADNGQAQYGSTGYGGSLDYVFNNAEDRNQSMQKVVESFKGVGKVSTYLWDGITTREVKEYPEGDIGDGYVVETQPDPVTGVLVSYPKFTTRHGSHVSFKRGVWDPQKRRYEEDRLKVINVPVLKAHFIFGVTGAMKGYMGVDSDKITAVKGFRTHQTVGKGGMGTLMAKTRVPVLNILDAIHVNARPGGGPKTSYSEATYSGIIAASTDPIALDHWASKKILCELGKAVYGADVSVFNPENTTKGSFGDWLRISANQLNNAGHHFTFDESRISVKLVKKTA